MPLSVAVVTATCDRCGREQQQVELVQIERNGYDTRNVEAELEEHGWSIDGDEYVGPNCIQEDAENG